MKMFRSGGVIWTLLLVCMLCVPLVSADIALMNKSLFNTSDELTSHAGAAYANAWDDNLGTFWQDQVNLAAPSFVKLRLLSGDAFTLQWLNISFYDSSYDADGGEVYGSNDDATWTYLGAWSGGTTGLLELNLTDNTNAYSWYLVNMTTVTDPAYPAILEIDPYELFVEGNESPVDTTGFDGATTNFSAINASEVDYPILEKIGSFKIAWNGENLDFAGANLSEYVVYGDGWVDVQSGNLASGINTSANVTLYGTYEGVEIYRDGDVCGDCTLVSYNGSDVVFTVSHFTNYSVGNGTANGSLILTSPENDSGQAELVDFSADLIQESGANTEWSCTLYVNDSVVDTQNVTANTSVTVSSVDMTAFAGQVDIPWYYACTNEYYNETVQSEVWTIAGILLPYPADVTGFDSWSNNLDNPYGTFVVDYPFVEKSNVVKIQWNGADLNFSNANLSAYVTYGDQWVNVDSENLPSGVNTSANITIYGVFEGAEVYRDGEICYDCGIIEKVKLQAGPYYESSTAFPEYVGDNVTRGAIVSFNNNGYVQDFVVTNYLSGYFANCTIQQRESPFLSWTTTDLGEGYAPYYVSPVPVEVGREYNMFCEGSTEVYTDGFSPINTTYVYFISGYTGGNSSAEFGPIDAVGFILEEDVGVLFSVPHFTNYSIGNGTANGSLTLTAPANGTQFNSTDLVDFTASLTQETGTNLSWSCDLYVNDSVIDTQNVTANASIAVNNVDVSAFAGQNVSWFYNCTNAYYSESVQSETWHFEVIEISYELTDGLVSYYSFNDMNSTTIPDGVGDVDWTRVAGHIREPYGKVWYALKGLNGNYIDTGSNYSLPDTNRMTVNVWVNTDGAIHYNPVFSDAGAGMHLAWYFDGVTRTYNWYYTGADYISYENSSGGWHMLTVTYNGAKSVLYYDGVRVANTSVVMDLNMSSMRIGERLGSYFKGTMDEFGIWNRSLSASEIADLYDAGNATTFNGTDFLNAPFATEYDVFINVTARKFTNGDYIDVFCVQVNSTEKGCTENGTVRFTDVLVNATLGTKDYELFVYNVSGYKNGSQNVSVAVVAEETDVVQVYRGILPFENISSVGVESYYWNATDRYIVPTWSDEGIWPWSDAYVTIGGQTVKSILHEDGEGDVYHSAGVLPLNWYDEGAGVSKWFMGSIARVTNMSHTGSGAIQVVTSSAIFNTSQMENFVQIHNSTTIAWIYDDGVQGSTGADAGFIAVGAVYRPDYSAFQVNPDNSVLVGFVQNQSTYFACYGNRTDYCWYDVATMGDNATYFGVRSAGWHKIETRVYGFDGTGAYVDVLFDDDVVIEGQWRVAFGGSNNLPAVAVMQRGSTVAYFDDITVYEGQPFKVNDLAVGDYTANVSVGEFFDVSASFAVTKLTAPTTVSPSGTTIFSPNVSVSWSAATGNYSPVTYDVYVNNTLVAANTSDVSLYYTSAETTDAAIFVASYDSLVSTLTQGENFNVTLEYLTVQLNNTINDTLVQSFCASVNSTSIGCTTNGSITWLDEGAIADNRSYEVAVTNEEGLYNVTNVFSVSGDATATLETRPVLQDISIASSAASYWVFGGGDAVMYFNSTNAGVTRNVTLFGTNGTNVDLTATINMSGTSGNASIATLDMPAPLQYVANITESVELNGEPYLVSAVSDAFVVSALQAGGNITPSNGTFYASSVPISWNAATGGYGAITYSVYKNINGSVEFIENTTGLTSSINVTDDALANAVVYVTDGYVTIADVGGQFTIDVLHVMFNVTSYDVMTGLQEFCIAVNGTDVGCTANGTLVWTDNIALMSTRDYLVSVTNMSGRYDVDEIHTVNGDGVVTMMTRVYLDVANVTTDKSAYWNGTDTQVSVSWDDNLYNGSAVLYLDGVTSFAGAAIPMENLSAGQHTVTVAIEEYVDGVLRYDNATSVSFFVSQLTHNDNVSPSGVQFYNPQLVYSWLPATGNISPVTYTVIENLNGTNVTVAENISETSVARNVSSETTDGYVYVTAYDDGYASQTMSNAVPFNVSLQYLTVQVNNSYTGAPVTSFCVASPFSGCTTNGTITWLDENAIHTTRSYNISQTNDLGLYNTSRSTSVTGDATIVLQTRPELTITSVTTDKGLYWNKTDTTVTTTVVSTAGPASVTMVVYDNAATGLTSPVNGFTVGSHNATATVSEVVEGTNFSTSLTSADFDVTKLAAGAVVSPSNTVLSTRYNQTFSWNAATDGLASPTYTVLYAVGGSNISVATGIAATEVNYTFSAQNVGNATAIVLVTDGYMTDIAYGLPFNLTLHAVITDVVCPAMTYPNEDDLPSIPTMRVNFTTHLERSVSTTPAVNMSKGALKYETSNCTQVSATGDDATWSCIVPVRYWYDAGMHTALPFWEGGQNSISTCEIAELLASKRTVNSVYFPTAAPGVANAESNVPVGMRNTGNMPFNVSMKAQTLVGRTVPSTTLNANTFKAGETLSYAQVMQANVSVPLNIDVENGQGEKSDIKIWLSMPSGQLVQEYYTVTPWQAEVTG